MVRAGLPIPSGPGSEVPLMDAIFSDIGDEQSIERDLSTFSGHVSNIKDFLGRVTDNSLVLLDELFAGTDPVQGTALAKSLLTWLAEKGATVAVTTHLESLKTLALEDARFSNAAVGFDLQELRPTYTLRLGLPGSSYALRIAQRLGLPEHLIERARGFSGAAGQAEVERILRGLERQRDKITAERDQARQERAKAEQSRRKYERELAKLHKREHSMVHEDTKRLMQEIESARELIREQTRMLQGASPDKPLTHEELEEKRKALEDQAKLASARLKAKERETVGRERKQATKSALAEGDEVWVKTFKRTGVIRDLQKDKAIVQVGGIRATVTLSELYHLKAGEGAPKTQEQRPVYRNTSKGSQPSVIAPQNVDNTVDLRGMRVDEALEKLEIYMDAMLRSQEPGLYVIHGHGTGALKRAVRESLPGTPGLQRYRPGERGEGGDGVTVVYLNV